MEFWLKSDSVSARWEFAQFTVDAKHHDEHLLNQLEINWQLQVRPLGSGPIATIARPRNESPGVLQARVFQFLRTHPEITSSNDFRHRWCLLEEAQQRLRRKPLQRVVQNVRRQYQDHLPLYDGL